MAKLRILYKNVLSTATIGGTSAPNLLTDTKSQATSVAADTSITLTTSSALSGNIAIVIVLAENPGSVALNLTSPTTASVTDASTNSFTTNTAGTGGLKYITLYTTASNASTFVINLNKATKISRILVGNYWEPKYNTSFGISIGHEDLTQYERLQSGDLYATLGPRHKTLNFELQYVDASEKFTLYEILRGIGKTKPVFVSAFPDNATDRDQEQMYSIYGRLTNLPAINYRMFSVYSSQFELQEF